MKPSSPERAHFRVSFSGTGLSRGHSQRMLYLATGSPEAKVRLKTTVTNKPTPASQSVVGWFSDADLITIEDKLLERKLFKREVKKPESRAAGSISRWAGRTRRQCGRVAPLRCTVRFVQSMDDRLHKARRSLTQARLQWRSLPLPPSVL